MMCDTKKQLRDKVVTLNNKLSAANFTVKQTAADLKSESELRKRAEVRVDIAEADARVLNYAIKYLEANQK